MTTITNKHEHQVAPVSGEKRASSTLPSPQTLPDAEVVIYDGDCQFCKKQVGNLFRWDGKGRLAFVSLHDPFVKQHYRELTHEQLMEQMYLITHDHQRLAGAKAFRHIAARLPKLWFLTPLLYIPGSLPLWQFLYILITKQRYRIAGRTGETCVDDACQAHYGKKNE